MCRYVPSIARAVCADRNSISTVDVKAIIQVCRNWYSVAVPLLSYKLSYPITRGCTCSICHGLRVRRLMDTSEVKRMRVVQTLLDNRKASRIQRLHITCHDPCSKYGSDSPSCSLQMMSFRRMCLATLLLLLPRARNVQHLQFDAYV